MAFVNEELTETQREELFKKKIKNPYGSFRDITEGIKPLYLTIDNNSGTWLAHCYKHHDTNDDIEEFIFMYKSNPIPVQAIKSIHEQQVCWKITRIDFPKGLLNDKEHFQTLLTNAFKAYHTSGWPGEESKHTEVIYGFELGGVL